MQPCICCRQSSGNNGTCVMATLVRRASQIAAIHVAHTWHAMMEVGHTPSSALQAENKVQIATHGSRLFLSRKRLVGADAVIITRQGNIQLSSASWQQPAATANSSMLHSALLTETAARHAVMHVSSCSNGTITTRHTIAACCQLRHRQQCNTSRPLASQPRARYRLLQVAHTAIAQPPARQRLLLPDHGCPNPVQVMHEIGSGYTTVTVACHARQWRASLSWLFDSLHSFHRQADMAASHRSMHLPPVAQASLARTADVLKTPAGRTSACHWHASLLACMPGTPVATAAACGCDRGSCCWCRCGLL